MNIWSEWMMKEQFTQFFKEKAKRKRIQRKTEVKVAGLFEEGFTEDGG